MADYISILKIVQSASSGIFRILKEGAAYKKAKHYLSDKYDLKIEKKVGGGSYPVISDKFPKEWDDKLKSLIEDLCKVERLDLSVCETCADIYLFLVVLEVKHEYRTNKKRTLYKSPTYDSLGNLSRGIGSEIALKLVQKELGEWLQDLTVYYYD